MKQKSSTIQSIINQAKKGKMFILVDNKDRENEGDLVVPASKINAKKINFMAKHGRGLICLALTQEKVKNVMVHRCYMNAHTHGMEPHIHKDDGDFTMLYYPRMDWKLEWGGGTSVYDEMGEEIDRHIPYKGNRLLVFDAYLPHQAMPVARECYHLRSIIVFKCYLR